MILPIQSELRHMADPEKSRLLSGFFKTGPGQYGEWDRFLGIKVPDTRKVVKKYLSIPILLPKGEGGKEFHF